MALSLVNLVASLVLGASNMSLIDMLMEGQSPQERFAQVQSLTDMLGGPSFGINTNINNVPNGGSSDWENVARRIATNKYDYSSDDFNALDSIIERESSWNPNAVNESSGAAGIAQRISGYGHGYEQDRPKQQINWLLNYIADRYGTPQDALAFKNSEGWY